MKGATEKKGDKETRGQGAGRAANLLVSLSPCLVVFLVLSSGALHAQQPPRVVVGSKAFTESVILAEVATQLARRTGAEVVHRPELGGTRLLWNALRQGEIDVYPEYTGTINQEIFARQGLHGEEAIRRALAEHGILMSRPLGFNNTYALGIRETLAAQLGIRKISDLREHPELKFGFSNEFMERGDGWPSLRDRYQLPQKDVTGLEHALAYRGLENGSIALTDLYSTDPEIRYYDLRILEDDLGHFPRYHAVLLYRAELAERAPEATAALLQLEGRIPRAAIVEMNSRAKPRSGQRASESRVAADFLKQNPFFEISPEESEKAMATRVSEEGFLQRLLKYTGQHLFLVAVSLSLAILISIPLGIVAAKRARLGQGVLAVTGIIQTLPGLALLVFIMALLHLVPPLPLVHKLPALGTLPAVIALFLYSLLPIIRNTFTGLHDIPLSVRESAEALGLPASARLRLIELPMASRAILAGIKTAAVINVGTATLGALVGAGGYGQPILTGIRLDDVGLILQGAVPAALLALLIQGLFEAAERKLVPMGLRLLPAE
jgi:osmoprotectant transport system permease protein